MQATAISGQELVARTSSFQYSPLSEYVVIFWAPGRASVIELDYPALSAIPMGGHDQQGRRWEVSTSPVCF